MNAPAKIACPHCPRKFRDNNAVRQHIKVKHGSKGIGAFKPEIDDDDESFADRAVQAEIDRAAGIDNPDIDWLLS